MQRGETSFMAGENACCEKRWFNECGCAMSKPGAGVVGLLAGCLKA
ncbi:hypothetical protein NG798_19460 [Ancylothrix sp. C2]|nr:hypothetical protein [Ancylothrix sp. D3o]MCT7951980.1 hypothetical protein [Ancylothrix sp. D3o]